MLKILGRASSINVRKVLWTCVELGRPFEREDWGVGFRPTSDDSFRALNPNALVPVIVDEGFVLWESNTICRWLAAEHGRSDLLPSAPRERACVERWMDWQLGDLNNAWRPAFMGLVRRSPRHQDAAAIADSTVEWNRLMAILDAQLGSGGPFVCGTTFTLADIVLGLSAHRWYATPIDRPPLPRLRAWYECVTARPAFSSQGCGEHP
ncbi:MAG: glutathione S-transferase [Aquincola sp.]|nr:glutathione S-transferase [Aquincola sp.]MDH4288044.1 glutathione S-transferase [Aquincola sp.]MDH5329834.1 glutathione S-transferase [Aquincola sp.]